MTDLPITADITEQLASFHYALSLWVATAQNQNERDGLDVDKLVRDYTKLYSVLRKNHLHAEYILRGFMRTSPRVEQFMECMEAAKSPGNDNTVTASPEIFEAGLRKFLVQCDIKCNQEAIDFSRDAIDTIIEQHIKNGRIIAEYKDPLLSCYDANWRDLTFNLTHLTDMTSYSEALDDKAVKQSLATLAATITFKQRGIANERLLLEKWLEISQRIPNVTITETPYDALRQLYHSVIMYGRQQKQMIFEDIQQSELSGIHDALKHLINGEMNKRKNKDGTEAGGVPAFADIPDSIDYAAIASLSQNSQRYR